MVSFRISYEYTGGTPVKETIVLSTSQARTGIRRALKRSASVACLLAFGMTPGAWAQSVDYQAMEQLFGEPVTTSVTGKPQRAADAPANIEIITQDDIRRSGALSLPDVLQFVTGLDVRMYGIGATDVGIRGYSQASNPHLMVLINGRQVYMVDYGRILWSALPVQLSEIRQIEVIKGPNSALYGFNAVGGVINIITYDPLRETVNTATLAGGTQDFATASVVGTAKIGETAGLRVSAGGFSARDFTPNGLSLTDRLTRQRPFSGNFNVDGRWRITPQIESFVEASYGTSRLSHPSPQSSYDAEVLHQWSARAGVTADTAMGVLSFSAYQTEVRGDGLGISIFGLRPQAVTEYQSVTVVQASDLVKLGTDHTLRFGMEFRRNSDRASVLNGSLTNTIFAASMMWDWQLAPSLTATNAIRLDHDEVSYTGRPSPLSGLTLAGFNAVRIDAPSFNSGLVWKATGADTFRLTLARGVQLPTIVEQGLQFDPGTISPIGFYGKPNLLPSITWNAGLDYDRSLPAIGSVLRMSLFAQRTDNVIATPFSGPLSVSSSGVVYQSAANVGYTTAAGFEVGIKGRSTSGWRWNLSYALAETTNHTSLNLGGFLTSAQLYARSAPQHVVVAGGGYSYEKWEADLMTRWQSSFLDVRGPDTPGPLTMVSVNNYLTVNARVAYRVADAVTLAVVAQQLNAPRLLTTAGAPRERRLIGSVTARF